MYFRIYIFVILCKLFQILCDRLIFYFITLTSLFIHRFKYYGKLFYNNFTNTMKYSIPSYVPIRANLSTRAKLSHYKFNFGLESSWSASAAAGSAGFWGAFTKFSSCTEISLNFFPKGKNFGFFKFQLILVNSILENFLGLSDLRAEQTSRSRNVIGREYYAVDVYMLAYPCIADLPQGAGPMVYNKCGWRWTINRILPMMPNTSPGLMTSFFTFFSETKQKILKSIYTFIQKISLCLTMHISPSFGR